MYKVHGAKRLSGFLKILTVNKILKIKKFYGARIVVWIAQKVTRYSIITIWQFIAYNLIF